MMKEFKLIWLVFVLFLVGCRDAAETTALTPTVNPAWERISVEEAEELVREWMFDRNPGMNPSMEFPLIETTPEEVWQRTGGQLFKVTEGNAMFMTLFIRDMQVLPLGMSFGGLGITDICVTDFDQDGEVELLYTYSWGSGIHRAHIGVYNLSLDKEIRSEFSFWNGDMAFEKIDDQTVYIYSAEVDFSDGNITVTPVNKLGQVILTETEGEMILSVIDEEGNAILEGEY